MKFQIKWKALAARWQKGTKPHEADVEPFRCRSGFQRSDFCHGLLAARWQNGTKPHEADVEPFRCRSGFQRSDFRHGLLAAACCGAGFAALAVVAAAQTLSGDSLTAALRRGGYVLVVRHASSPPQAPTRQSAIADNVNLERQLDAAGRSGSEAMGKALRDLKIPVGEVLSSPTYRALETARFAQLANPQTHVELGDRGQSMQGVTEADAEWLRKRAAQAPKTGNTIIVTHMPNISRAFPQAAGVADGEALVFRPGGQGEAVLVGRIKIEEWPGLR
jgi:phosphohistidine phosphatase SixA